MSDLIPDFVTLSLSTRLRVETADMHRRAERSGVMRAILHGEADVPTYVALLRNLHPVYATLERRLAASADDPVVGPFRDSALDRAPAIAHDLVALYGPAWERLPVTDAALAYARRIEGSTADGLVAHAYVRYLGDLSGGQALRGVLARAFGERVGDALTFYDFPLIPNLTAYKERFRAALDALPTSSASDSALVAEAVTAFAMNVSLVDAVGPQTPSSDEQLPLPGA